MASQLILWQGWIPACRDSPIFGYVEEGKGKITRFGEKRGERLVTIRMRGRKKRGRREKEGEVREKEILFAEKVVL